jgi:hypothetical protein
MYIEKRWLVPAALSLLLLGAPVAIALLLLDSRVPEVAGSVRAAEISSAGQGSETPELTDENATDASAPEAIPAAELTPPVEVAPPVDGAPPVEVAPPVEAASTPKAAPVAPQPAADAAPAIQQPEEVVDIGTIGSEDRQINTRGFGDIGMQFQNVHINAPITNVHVSNQGNNNATNVNIGDHDKIVSEQEHLQSNRSNGSAPLASTRQPAESGSEPQAGAESKPWADAPPRESSNTNAGPETASAPVTER